MNTGNIVISSNSYVQYEYCTDMVNGTCVERMIVVPEESTYIREISDSEMLSHTAVFIIVILLLVWIIKGIFKLIFPSIGRK